MTRSGNKVWVTGMGCATPIGCTLSDVTQSLKQGRSGITCFDESFAPDIASRVVGQILDLPIDEYIPPKEQRRMDRFIHLAMVAGLKAWADADLDKLNGDAAHRTGVITGIGVGGIGAISRQQTVLEQRGAKRVNPFLIPMCIPNLASGHLGIRLGIQGPNLAIASACASGSHAIGEAFYKIQSGQLDRVLVGGCEAVLVPISVAGFANMRALSTRYNKEPERASRPFDRDRDGFVIAEGAGYVVLESQTHAEARQAKGYGEILGYGSTSDAYHVALPAPEGKGGEQAMRMALKDAQLSPEQIGYVNAHGTSTPAGDELELMAISRVLGDRAKHTYVSSTKSLTGHMLGAAGSCEMIFSLLAIREGFYPPTLNLENPVDSYGLSLVGRDPVPADRSKAFMTNSFGFGGTNAVLVVRPEGSEGTP